MESSKTRGGSPRVWHNNLINLDLVDRYPSGRFKLRPRLDQERRHRGGNQERDGDAGEDQLVALRAVVDRAGDKGAEDGAPGVEEIHVAADHAEGFAAEEISHRSLIEAR